MSILERINGPADLKALSAAELETLAEEIRSYLITSVAKVGGHLGPNLGVVEVSIAMHRVFNSPVDSIVFDTGHQSYVHKLLTGRKNFDNLRQKDGIAGYPQRAESEHDIVESSHASSSLSWADGIAKAYRLTGQDDRYVVALIGDGALTGGMAWEALNNISDDNDRKLVIIVNDNGRSYAPTIGGFARTLNDIRTEQTYRKLYRLSRKFFERFGWLGRSAFSMIRGAGKGLLGSVTPKSMFPNLDLKYIGPIDGHDLEAVEQALEQAKKYAYPVIVHVITQKGKGFDPAMLNEADQFHAVGQINPETGESLETATSSWTKVFGSELVQLAEKNDRLVAITGAMLNPVGLGEFAKRFPNRVFDVGIAEQHAVTMAAGMACEGLKPVVAIYSTFLQRAFDQLIHDVGIQNLPVTFVLDRAGIVGADGPTHQGQYDISYFRSIPNFTVMAPKDEAELQRMLVTSIHHRGPSAIRIPRGEGEGVPIAEEGFEPLDIGRGELLTDGDDLLIVAYGAMVAPAMETAGLLQEKGVRAAVVNARFLRPLDEALILPMAQRIGRVVTMEEGALPGGFGAAVVETLNDHDVLVPVFRIGIPDVLVDHASPDQSKQALGLTPPQMAERILERYGISLQSPVAGMAQAVAV